jgi:triosephosphate isomerase
MARRKFVCGNWKMHGTVAEAVALARQVQAGLAEASGGAVQVAIAPPYTALHPVAQALAGTRLELAAQDVHWEAKGAFTGEVSAGMLAEVGCRHGIVGHSERRQLFGETDETVRKKVGALLAANVLPIVCVGETLADARRGRPSPWSSGRSGGRSPGSRRRRSPR